MIRYISLVLLFVVLSLSSHSANRRIDSLLVQLDRAVEKRAYYTELKNERIADLRRQMQNATSLTDKIR